MFGFARVNFSRRTLLQMTAVGTGMLFVPNFASSDIHNDKQANADIESSPGAINRYLAKTKAVGITSLEGVEAEYAKAVESFPFVKPDDWSFPTSSGLTDPEPGTQWDRGFGAAIAYLLWQSAVAVAAQKAYLAGDRAVADRYLDVLEAGYLSPVRRAVLDDPDDAFISGPADKSTAQAANNKAPVASARGGDYSLLEQVAVRR